MVQAYPTVPLHVANLATAKADNLLLLGRTCTLFALLVLIFVTTILSITLLSRLHLLSKVKVHWHGTIVGSRVYFTLYLIALSFVLPTWQTRLPMGSHVQGRISWLSNLFCLLQGSWAGKPHVQLHLRLQSLHKQVNQVWFLGCIITKIHHQIPEHSNVLLHTMCLPNMHDTLPKPILMIHIPKGSTQLLEQLSIIHSCDQIHTIQPFSTLVALSSPPS